MLLSRNIRLALESLRSSRWRSFLTMLGIIIGVASVVVTVSIGEGVKKQVTTQINHLGPDLVTVRPGQTVSRDKNGNVDGVNYFSTVTSGAFSEPDWQAIKDVGGVKMVVPFNVVSASPRAGGDTMSNSFIIGTSPDLPSVLNQKLEFGAFFMDSDANKYTAVIGKRVAEQLFHENVPIGKSLQIRGQQFEVRGIFEEFPTSPLISGTNFNTAIFIPYNASKEITEGQVQVYQVMVKPDSSDHVKQVVTDIGGKLRARHGGEEDFTILRQDENLAIANNMLNILTAFIAGVAAISLLVGGIGIMNIMLVLVSERTREIGVRKAVGATNRQILMQFLVEAMVISVVGGILGVLTSILANYFIRIFTELRPVITIPIMFISTGVALMVGMIFGTMPALRAARKDPIESLRHE